MSIFLGTIGEKVELKVVGRSFDDCGDAIVVEGEQRIGGGIPHITISCAKGIKPFYSNELLARRFDPITPFTINGVIAAKTKHGWKK